MYTFPCQTVFLSYFFLLFQMLLHFLHPNKTRGSDTRYYYFEHKIDEIIGLIACAQVYEFRQYFVTQCSVLKNNFMMQWNVNNEEDFLLPVCI